MRSGDGEYYQSIWCYAPDFVAARPKRLRTIVRVWDYRVVVDYQPVPGGRLLDIGCGAGEFLYLARERYGYQVAGVDFNEEAVHLARTLYGIENVVCGSWPAAAEAVAQGAFDRVTMFHVVEHLEDPVKAIRAAVTALRPGGLLAVAVPALQRRPALFAGLRDLPPHHLTLWSERSLIRIFEAAGLQTVWLVRAPFLPDNLIVHCQERCSLLRRSDVSRVVWVVGSRLLAPLVAVMRGLYPTVGYSIVGIARVPTLRRP